MSSRICLNQLCYEEDLMNSRYAKSTLQSDVLTQQIQRRQESYQNVPSASDNILLYSCLKLNFVKRAISSFQTETAFTTYNQSAVSRKESLEQTGKCECGGEFFCVRSPSYLVMLLERTSTSSQSSCQLMLLNIWVYKEMTHTRSF